MEYCSGGDLFEILIKKGNFKEIYLAKLIKKIISAIEYLHCRVFRIIFIYVIFNKIFRYTVKSY